MAGSADQAAGARPRHRLPADIVEEGGARGEGRQGGGALAAGHRGLAGRARRQRRRLRRRRRGPRPGAAAAAAARHRAGRRRGQGGEGGRGVWGGLVVVWARMGRAERRRDHSGSRLSHLAWNRPPGEV